MAINNAKIETIQVSPGIFYVAMFVDQTSPSTMANASANLSAVANSGGFRAFIVVSSL